MALFSLPWLTPTRFVSSCACWTQLRLFLPFRLMSWDPVAPWRCAAESLEASLCYSPHLRGKVGHEPGAAGSRSLCQCCPAVNIARSCSALALYGFRSSSLRRRSYDATCALSMSPCRSFRALIERLSYCCSFAFCQLCSLFGIVYVRHLYLRWDPLHSKGTCWYG